MNPPPERRPPAPIRWRQAGWITAGAAALILGLHLSSHRPGLNHLDFVAGGADALQFCDPDNPSFLAVVARSSPVTMAAAAPAAEAGRPAGPTLVLKTITGKPIGPADLLPVFPGGAVRLQLLIVDPSLEDFQAAQGRPGSQPGKWTFDFTPLIPGVYRVFADLTPAATGREIYASADLPVAPSAVRPGLDGRNRVLSMTEVHGYRFLLATKTRPIYARQSAELMLTVIPADDRSVSPPSLEPTANLTIFDENRNGLVNLHAPSGPTSGPAPARRGFIFRATMADPGRYVAWCRIGLGDQEVRIRLRFQVMP